MSEESQEFDRDFMNEVREKQNERAKEFLSCLGNGKTIYQIESEEEL